MKKIKLAVLLLGVSLIFGACGGQSGSRDGNDNKDNNGSVVNEVTAGIDDVGAGNSENSDANNGGTDNGGGVAGNGGREAADLVFDTVDINGNAVTQEITYGAKVVMLNLWEPWCGPCVGEMPDLELLYEKYKDDGLLIIGAYCSFDYDSDAKDIISSIGTTYPILKCDKNLYSYEQDYVPATFFFDENGRLIEKEPYAGSRPYDDWDTIIRSYLFD